MEINVGNKTAILFGATGLVGQNCLDFLLSSGAYNKVVSLGRRKVDVEHDKLIQHIVDFNQLSNYASLLNGDDLFLCLGTTIKKAGSKEAFYKVDFTYFYQIASLARSNGINQILVVSSVSADKDSSVFYLRVKGEMEEAVKGLNFWATHIFRPSLLLGERNENRFGEKIAKVIGRGLDFILRGLLTKYKPIEADVVAKAMVSAAQTLEKGVHIYASHQLQELASREDALRLQNYG